MHTSWVWAIKYSLNKNVRHRLSPKQFVGLKGVEKKSIGESEYEVGMEMLMKMGKGFKKGFMGMG